MFTARRTSSLVPAARWPPTSAKRASSCGRVSQPHAGNAAPSAFAATSSLLQCAHAGSLRSNPAEQGCGRDVAPET
jgi:hypothetical protein